MHYCHVCGPDIEEDLRIVGTYLPNYTATEILTVTAVKTSNHT
jgi:hypothetical protein